jgi:hypothetical protein
MLTATALVLIVPLLPKLVRPVVLVLLVRPVLIVPLVRLVLVPALPAIHVILASNGG